MRRNRFPVKTIDPITLEFNRRASSVDDFIARAKRDPDTDADIKYLIHDLKVMTHKINEMFTSGDGEFLDSLDRMLSTGYDLADINRDPYYKWAKYVFEEYEKIDDKLAP